MANAPARPCAVPKCPNLNCQVKGHTAEPWRTRDRPLVTRIRGRELQRRRAKLFAEKPWCEDCLDDGRRVRATIREHDVPLAEGGTEDESNIKARCLDCSDRKTERESQRGVVRSQMTPRFRKSSTPRTDTGRFIVRRQTR